MLPDWRRALSHLDRARDALRAARPVGAPRLTLYRGFGTERSLGVSGRVLRDVPIPAATLGDGAWRNLVATLRRFDSREVPGARVRLVAGDTVRVVTADVEGYFHASIEPTLPLSAERAWHEVAVELLPARAGEP